MARLISRTYGEALFELAVEEHKEDLFLEESEGLLQILSENPELMKVLKHPKIAREEKVRTLKEIFGGRISEEMMGFLALMVEKDRIGSIEETLTYFIDKMKEYKGIGIAYVQTAVSLTEEQKKQVEARLLATTNYKKMEMHFDVQENLIGGMVIRIGDRVVDSSIRSKMEDLERSLMKIRLA